MERLADNGDELQNVASNAEYQQIYVAYVLFFKTFILSHVSVFLKAVYEQTMVGVPVSQFEKSWQRLCMSEMPICGNKKLSHKKVMGAVLQDCIFYVCALNSTNFHYLPLPMALYINQTAHQL